jgi:hypothetical protein
LRLLLTVQVAEITVELVEAMNSRQNLVQIAKMVLAKLPGGITEPFEQFSDCWIFGREPDRRGRTAAAETDAGLDSD